MSFRLPTQLLEHFERISEAPDAVARLRRFILDLAVRGKLVEQDPNDEPAVELLKRIQAEKEKSGITPRRKDAKKDEKLDQEILGALAPLRELPFAIPNRWEWSQLAVVGVISPRNAMPDNALASFVPMPMISAEYGIPNRHETRPWGDIKTGYTHFAEGDVGLAKITPCFENGKSTIFRELTGGAGAGTTELHIVRPVIVSADYILIFLKCPYFIETGITKMTGTAGQKRVPAEYFARSPFPLPPLAEQHRIVAKVDELMALCDQLEMAKNEREARRDRLVAASLHRINHAPRPLAGEGAGERVDSATTLPEAARFHLDHLPRLTTRPEHIKQLRQTILNLAVRGRLVPQDPNDEPAEELLKRIFLWRDEAIQSKQIREPRKPLKKIDHDEAPYALPKGWVWARLGEVIYIQSGDGLTAANMKAGDVPVFGGNGINGYHDEHNIKEATIVIGRVGYYCGSIHVTPKKAWVTDNAFITRFCQQAISMEFLVLLLNGTNLKENENATAQPVISGSKIYPIVIGLPPLAEQHRIVAKVDELMALCDQLGVQLTTNQTDSRRLLEAVLRDALAPAMEKAA